MTSLKRILVVLTALATPAALLADQPAVRVEPATLHGPRPLEEQTATAVVRDYLESWESLRGALGQNRADLLDPDFVGIARDKLANAIQEQSALGMRTRYLDKSHDLRIVFYSPEGLSVQLVDNVEYDVQVLDHEKLLTSQHVHARYIVVLTPAEMRWRVRIFQEERE